MFLKIFGLVVVLALLSLAAALVVGVVLHVRERRVVRPFLLRLLATEPYVAVLGVVDAVERETGREVSIASVFSVLSDLEREGLVTSAVDTAEPAPARGGRRRRLYRLAAGIKEATRA